MSCEAELTDSEKVFKNVYLQTPQIMQVSKGAF